MQFFTIEYDVSCGYFVDALYQVEKVSIYSSFVECFIMKEFWMLSNGFYASIEIFMFSVFYSINLVYFIDCRVNIKMMFLTYSMLLC